MIGIALPTEAGEDKVVASNKNKYFRCFQIIFKNFAFHSSFEVLYRKVAYLKLLNKYIVRLEGSQHIHYFIIYCSHFFVWNF